MGVGVGVGVGMSPPGGVVGVGMEPAGGAVGAGPRSTGGAWVIVLLPAVGAGRAVRFALVGAASTGFKETLLPRIKATAFPPAVPSLLPSISRPEVSCRPEGDVPLIVSSTGLVRANAFLGVSVTVSFAGLKTAELNLIAGSRWR